MMSVALSNLVLAAVDLAPSPMHDLARLLAHSKVPPRKPAVECRWCGNPHVVAGKPCRYCAVVTGPAPDRAPWQCPTCKGVPRMEVERNPARGEVLFVVRCHNEHRVARVSDRELEDLLERDAAATLMAMRVAEAVDRFAESEAA